MSKYRPAQFTAGLSPNSEVASTIREWLAGMSGTEAFAAANAAFHEGDRLCGGGGGKEDSGKSAEGLCVEHEDDAAKSREEVHFCSGLRHGLFRTFSSTCSGGREFERLGRFDRGARSGAEWRRMAGDSFLVLMEAAAADVDENNNSSDAPSAGSSFSPAAKCAALREAIQC